MGVLGLRYSQVLGLSAGHLSVELGEPEQRRPHALLAHLGGLTLRLEALIAHKTVAAGDLERYHHPVTGLDVGNLGTDLLYHAHRLVAEDVTLLHKRREYLVEVKVGAADVGRRDAYDGVGGFLYGGIGNAIYPNVAFAMPPKCLHLRPPMILSVL